MFLKEKHDTSHIVVERDDEQHDEGMQGIRCPHCRWRPSKSDQWSCINFGTPEPPFPSCGTSWNTFDTRGVCPGCSHKWKWTLCLRCQQWSLHEAWYEP
jgi:hypothetical protein